MSEEAKEELEQIVNAGYTDFQDVKDLLADRHDISEDTAYQYVMDYCWVEGRGDDKTVEGVKDPTGTPEATAADAQAATGGDGPTIENTTGRDSSQVIRVPNVNVESGERTNNQWHNLPVLEDNDHPLVPETKQYFERPMGETTDITKLTWALNHDDYGVLLVGDAGAGKGHSVKWAAWNTNWPTVRLNFGVNVTKEKLIGKFVPKDHAEQDVIGKVDELEADGWDRSEAIDVVSQAESSFEWRDGLLTKAVRYGWWFIADEINVAPPEALVALNGLLEDQGNRTLEIEETGEVIKPHPNFRVIGTMNEDYVGTQKMNPAFEDRFIQLHYDYLEPRAEEKLLKQQTSLQDDDKVETLVEVANDLRSQYPETIKTPISPRMLFKIADMTSVTTFEDSVQTILHGAVNEDDETAVMTTLKNKMDIDESNDGDGLGGLMN
jgi:MoxR-like ATPase